MNTHSQHTPSKSVGRRPDRPAHPRPRQNEEPPDAQAGGFSSILRAYPITLGITVLSALFLMTAAAFAVYRSPDPTARIPPASAAVLAVSSLIGGIVAGRMNSPRPMAAALVCGGLTAALLILLSLVFGGEKDLLGWVMEIGVLPMHLLGGVIARPKQKTPTHTAGKHPSRR